jgi:hypothetical protein
MTLKAFREQLASLMVERTERPFVCDGSPLEAQVFVVGLNPATTLREDFWSFWNDSAGFDRRSFDLKYGAVRPKKSGNRPRIEAITRAFPRGQCLETNIYSSPTKSGPMIKANQKRTAVFEQLIAMVQPKALFIHGAPTYRYFAKLSRDIEGLPDDTPKQIVLWGRNVTVMLRRHRALYTVALSEAESFGQLLASAVRAS